MLLCNDLMLDADGLSMNFWMAGIITLLANPGSVSRSMNCDTALHALIAWTDFCWMALYVETCAPLAIATSHWSVLRNVASAPAVPRYSSTFLPAAWFFAFLARQKPSVGASM